MNQQIVRQKLARLIARVIAGELVGLDEAAQEFGMPTESFARLWTKLIVPMLEEASAEADAVVEAATAARR